MTNEALFLPAQTTVGVHHRPNEAAPAPSRRLGARLLTFLALAASTPVSSPFVGSLGPNGTVLWSQINHHGSRPAEGSRDYTPFD